MSIRHLAGAIVVALTCCGVAAIDVRETLPVEVPLGIPKTLWISRAGISELTPNKVSLGEDLFRDPILSADGTVSCASCHDPSIGYASRQPLAIGVGRQVGARNAPTIFNAVFSDVLLWDGRARSFEEQALIPLLNPVEMGAQTEADVIRRLNENSRYRKRFSVNFGEVSMPALLRAIGAFERTLLSGDSAFDRSLAGEGPPLSGSAQRGWELFRGRAGCVRCHSFTKDRPFFTDFRFHNTGIAARRDGFPALARMAERAHTPSEVARIAADPATSELGRFRITGNPADIGAFKTPTLRDVAMTGPYMHDGSIVSLAAVVAHYNQGGTGHSRLSPELTPLHLDARSQQDLIAFLESLTGSGALERAGRTLPERGGNPRR